MNITKILEVHDYFAGLLRDKNLSSEKREYLYKGLQKIMDLMKEENDRGVIIIEQKRGKGI